MDSYLQTQLQNLKDNIAMVTLMYNVARKNSDHDPVMEETINRMKQSLHDIEDQLAQVDYYAEDGPRLMEQASAKLVSTNELAAGLHGDLADYGHMMKAARENKVTPRTGTPSLVI